MSKTAMKREKMSIDFENDTAIVGGKRLKLNLSSAGHYLMPLSLWLVREADVFLSVNGKEPRKLAEKLHKQFGHAKVVKLIDLIRHAGIKDKLIKKNILEVVDSC